MKVDLMITDTVDDIIDIQEDFELKATSLIDAWQELQPLINHFMSEISQEEIEKGYIVQVRFKFDGTEK